MATGAVVEAGTDVPGSGYADRALLRVTVTAGDRRADLAVPGGVPVADLLPDLASTLGLLDPETAGAGHRVTTTRGQVLSPAAGLEEQGVPDGARLTLLPGADEPARRVHDDPAEALADAVAGELDPWEPAATRRTTLVAAALLVVLGPVPLVLAGQGLVPGVTAAVAAGALLVAGWSTTSRQPSYAVGLGLVAGPYAAVAGMLLVPDGAPAPVVAALAAGGAAAVVAAWPGGGAPGLGASGAAVAVALVTAVEEWWLPDLFDLAPVMLALVALAGGLAPGLVVGAVPETLSGQGLATRVRVAHDVLLAVSVGTGILLVLLVPLVVARGAAGAALAVAASAAVLLRTRHHRVAVEVVAGVVAGTAGLLASAASVAVLLPDWRPAAAIALPLAGLLLLAGTLLPVGSSLHRARAADLAESAVLLAVLPLMVVAVGLLDRVV